MSELNRNYWMFIVMDKWFPGLWKTMVDRGIAAQHYPPGWTNEHRNIKALSQIRRGDQIVAAFWNFRFGEYGTITSPFECDPEARSKFPSLEIWRENEHYQFRERFDCDWVVVPFDDNVTDCSDLKHKHDIRLYRGCCVKEISEEAFNAIKAMLDHAGAKTLG